MLDTTVARVQRAAIEADWQLPPKAEAKTEMVKPRPKKRDFPDVKPAEYNFDADLSVALREALGEDGFLRLVERYGGIRLYVPADVRASGLADEITIQHATTLVAAFAGVAIRVPLARRFRHGIYKRWGYSNSKIARMLGVTETAITKMNADHGCIDDEE
ncbi:hypothetical protein [Shinella fusca]|uniref:Mor transcription activator domain-containing protein n=1 Tax=Shinella fusca TaxID=544480 RepID=A0A7W7YWM5_9HYPH|nr:hypothetical protein [Shinella fusca]MBB5043545.1 hypothetical protein [Shinella fusca]